MRARIRPDASDLTTQVTPTIVETTGSSAVVAVAADAHGFVSAGGHESKPAIWTTTDGRSWETIVLPLRPMAFQIARGIMQKQSSAQIAGRLRERHSIETIEIDPAAMKALLA